MRKSMKGVPWTEKAEKLAIARLAKLAAEGYDPHLVLDEAVLRGWRGIFPVHEALKAKPKLQWRDVE